MLLLPCTITLECVLGILLSMAIPAIQATLPPPLRSTPTRRLRRTTTHQRLLLDITTISPLLPPLLQPCRGTPHHRRHSTT